MSLARRRHEARTGWLFITPALLHLIVFALMPIAVAFVISLYKWQLFKPDGAFVAFNNYFYAFTEGPFWNAMWNSFRYAVVAVPLGMFVALLVALLVNQKLAGITIFRTLFYVPAISSGVAIAMIWIYIYLPGTGLINTLTLRVFGKEGALAKVIGAFGIAPYESIDFLAKPEWAMWALVFMSVWTGLGPRMVLFLAGLIGINPSLYEAASLDGAGKLRCFWNVTLPMLVPTTFFVMVTSTIGAMQVFTPVYMMTKGGPEDTTDVVGYHIYTEAWVNFNTGLASSKSFILLAVVVAISFFQFRMMKRQMEGYSAE
ncbi:MAG TPA: sugar ABC transporter permease [Fimbriimonadaceae bacterium]|nr:sugar ABC transporter permease [Fimbriimonadaceae bacterium]